MSSRMPNRSSYRTHFGNRGNILAALCDELVERLFAIRTHHYFAVHLRNLVIL